MQTYLCEEGEKKIAGTGGSTRAAETAGGRAAARASAKTERLERARRGERERLERARRGERERLDGRAAEQAGVLELLAGLEDSGSGVG